MSTTVDQLDALVRAVSAAPPRLPWAWAAGDHVGPYLIREPIARGGMGEVYRAHDPRLGRDVALKALPALPLQPDANARFDREARLLATLQHPGVVTVFDSGRAGDVPYIVLDYLEGETLRQVLSRGPLSLEEARAWIGAVGDAIAAVHAKGIVHRDLKPENVFRTRSGLIQVLDFGLAKLVDGPRDLTGVGQIVGTLDYMAPEQVTGGEIGPAADQFALVVLLVEMLTGRRLFRRPSAVETMYAIAHEPVRVRRLLGPDVPAHWVAAIERGLARDPEARHADVSALLEALSAPIAAPVPPADVSVRYARNGPVHLAYRVFGEGPVELVLVPGFVSQVEEWWSEPEGAAFMEALGRMARVVVFDKRGTGLSDRPSTTADDADEALDDLCAVMDAAKMERVVVLGLSEGGPQAVRFAVRHPQRARALVLYGTAARFRSARKLAALHAAITERWGGGGATAMLAPSAVGVPRLEAWFQRWERLSASPGAALGIIAALGQVDVRPELGALALPTLVIHRRDDRLVGVEGARELAAHIAGATLVEVEGDDHAPMLGDTGPLLSAIRDFLARIADRRLTGPAEPGA